MPKKLNLTGQRFGRLLVLCEGNGRYTAGGNHINTWICLCDCGEIIEVDTGNLTKGNTKSCGCWIREYTSNRNKLSKKTNRYDLTSNNYGIGWTLNGTQFLFDKEDFDKIKDYCWRTNSVGYIVTNQRINETKRTTSFIQRFIMDVSEEDWTKIQVDHINGDKLDNRKCNLRIVSPTQNNQNKGKTKSNKSGCTGVFYNKSHNKWEAVLMHNYTTEHLGFYNDIDDAIQMRKKAEDKYFCEYSYDNSMKIAETYALQEVN